MNSFLPIITTNKKDLKNNKELFEIISDYLRCLFGQDMELLTFITDKLKINPNDIEIELDFDENNTTTNKKSFNMTFTIPFYNIKIGLYRFIYYSFEDVFIISVKYGFMLLAEILILSQNLKERQVNALKSVFDIREAIERETYYPELIGINYAIKNYLELLNDKKEGIGLSDEAFDKLSSKCLIDIKKYTEVSDQEGACTTLLKQSLLELTNNIEEELLNILT